MSNTIAILMASAGLLTLLAIYRRWKHKSALLLNIIASALLYCAASFRAYGESLSAIQYAYKAILSYRQGQVFFVTIIVMPWLLSHIVGRLLRLMDREEVLAKQTKLEAEKKAEELRLQQEEEDRQELREMIGEISDYRLDIVPFLSAVEAGGQKNPKFSSAVAGCKRHAQGIRARCERLNHTAKEMNVTERASVFTR